jgi:DNA topoisomerase VI subunit A
LFDDLASNRELPQFNIPSATSFDSDSKWIALGSERSSALNMKRGGFAVLLRVLAEAYVLLKSNSKRTIRDIYYNDVPFYKNQVAVSNALSHACRLLRVDRSSLNIEPTAKGLVVGDISIAVDGLSFLTFDAASSKCTNLLPAMSQGLTLRTRAARCVLVVEKDTVYQVTRAMTSSRTLLLDCCLATV